MASDIMEPLRPSIPAINLVTAISKLAISALYMDIFDEAITDIDSKAVRL